MENQFLRTEILLGSDAMKKLKSSKVAIFGVGGVGGYVAEALARCGVGAFELIDRDQVSVTNLNRQIIATWKTIGMDKTEAMADRIHDIKIRRRWWCSASAFTCLRPRISSISHSMTTWWTRWTQSLPK